ncbi:MAG: YfbR-like 5'-deoxynucleotidase [Hafnia sp.]
MNSGKNYKRYFLIQDTARASNVGRWHSVPCHRYQSIAEHQYMVTMYGRELLKRIMPSSSVQDRCLLMEYCLVHDLPEVITGDMATPVKLRLESFYADGECPLDKLEVELCQDYADLKEEIDNTPLARIAKLADVLEAIKFIKEEGKHQSNTYDSISVIRDALIDTLDAMLNQNGEARLDDFKRIKESLIEAKDLEAKDPINRIYLERMNAYDVRVESAKEQWPEYDWDEAYKIRHELLFGLHSQIDFIDHK